MIGRAGEVPRRPIGLFIRDDWSPPRSEALLVAGMELKPMLKIVGIPLLMATQHPDSASRGFTAYEEVKEALLDLLPLSEGGFGCDEKMIDYEGKLTPYQQPKWVIEEAVKAGLVPGEDFLITPRVPAERLEEPDRQIFVLWGIMSANKYSISTSGKQAIRYVIHPMAESPVEIVALQRRVLKVQRLAEEEIGLHSAEPPIVVPLIEDVFHHIHVTRLLDAIKTGIEKQLGIVYSSFRVFLGKSDAALRYGHLASTISLVLALNEVYEWSRREEIPVYTIIGVGKPPFRGHLSPQAIGIFVQQYNGYHTVTIQSALRFDTPRREYIHVVKVIADNVAKQPSGIGGDEKRELIKAARISTYHYLLFLLQVLDVIYMLSKFIPRRRERLAPEQYGRDVNMAIAFSNSNKLLELAAMAKMQLPRAITFTACMYTLGIPPSLIGLGRTFEDIAKGSASTLDIVLRRCPLLKQDIRFDMKWVSIEVAKRYLHEKLLELVLKDLALIKEYVGEEPHAEEEYVRLLLEIRDRVSSIKPVEDLMVKAGLMRGFLG